MNALKKVAAGACAALTAAGLLIAQHAADASTGPTLTGYPNAKNAGLPAKPKLIDVPAQQSSGLGWHWDPRGWVVIDGKDALFKGFRVTGSIEIYSDGATVSYNDASNSGEGRSIGMRPGSANVRVYRNDFHGPCTICDNRLTYGITGDLGGDTDNDVIARNDFSMIDHPLQMESGVIRGNYVHDVAYKSNGVDHPDAFFASGGDNGLTVYHNTLLCDADGGGGCTSAIMLNNADGADKNITVSNNLLSGGGFTFYGGGAGTPCHNCQITDNVFSTAFLSKFGTTAYTDGDSMSGNTFLDGPRAGQAIHP